MHFYLCFHTQDLYHKQDSILNISCLASMTLITLHTASFCRLLCLCFLALLLLPTLLVAQNEIVPNDNAVLLRNIWMVRGATAGGDRVGEGAGWVGDVNHSGQEDFAVLIGSTAEWRVYVDSNGKHTTTPFWTFDSGAGVPWRPVVGNFRGDSNLLVAFTRADMRIIEGVPHLTARLLFYEVKDSLGKPDQPVMVLNTATYIENASAYPRDILVSDLDGDGDDELILVFGSFLRNLERIATAEIWIYEGGADFQLDSPSVVLKDTRENNPTFYGAAIARLDGDGFPDILTSANYQSDPSSQVNIWWGGQAIHELSVTPDRSIDLNQTVLTLPPTMPALLDLDGDHIDDVVGTRLVDVEHDRWEIYYFSSKSASARSRRFDRDDAQKIFVSTSLFAAGSLGYLNDSLRRFEMLTLLGPSPEGGAGIFGLSGGKLGPNASYDALYSSPSGSVFGVGGVVPNCSGSGWDCFLTANPAWFGGDQGIAILLEGGPYIPNDDTTLSIQSIATEEHEAALHIWPNPVVDELHVAWRGDLKSSPATLRVFDLNGRQIVEGDVDGWRGEALWKCGSVSPGTYLLIVYDHQEVPIARTRIIKQ